MDKINLDIAVIGLGYVGLPLAVELKKFNVVGYDIDKLRIKELENNFDRTNELSTKELDSIENITFSSNEASLKDCNFYIITVPTPINDSNTPDLKYLQSSSKLISRYLTKDNIVVYESTVYPGCTEDFCVPILEKESGLVFNKDFYCGYSPERINPGDKVHTISKIKKVVSGSSDIALDVISHVYSSIIDAGIHKASSIKVAEAAKVIENSQRDLNIAFVNELSHIFNLIGIDTYDVLEAAGTKWNFLNFEPGLVGGHCISVDPYYLTHKAQSLGYNPQVILSGRRINDNFAHDIAINLIKKINKNLNDISKVKIGIFGVTFKENCPDTRNSKVFDFVKELSDWGAKIYVDDPYLNESNLKNIMKIDFKLIGEIEDLDVICLMVPHQEYLNMDISQYKNYCKKNDHPIFFDLKSKFDRKKLKSKGFNVIRL